MSGASVESVNGLWQGEKAQTAYNDNLTNLNQSKNCVRRAGVFADIFVVDRQSNVRRI